LWRDYVRLGVIIGIDIKLPEHFVPGEHIQMFEGSQPDKQFLSEVADKVAPEGFDIIIDDASHIGELAKKTFWHLFDHHLKPGGLYAMRTGARGIRMMFLTAENSTRSHRSSIASDRWYHNGGPQS
jgi:hypothetical protein